MAEVRILSNEYKLVIEDVAEQNACLAFLGDVHIGGKTCNLERFQEVIGVLKEKKARVVLMGDILECASKRSVAAGWVEQVLSPDDQIDTAVQCLEPIKDQIIGSVMGNHEYRIYKEVGLDVAGQLMHKLDRGKFYVGWEFYGTITGKSSGKSVAYGIYAVHSQTGNKTGGLGLAQMQRDFSSIVHADIVAKAHNHKNAFEQYICNTINTSCRSVEEKVINIICTGHYLKRANSYAAGKPYGGTPDGTHLLHMAFSRDKKVLAERI